MIDPNESIRFAGSVSIKEISVITAKNTIQNITNQILDIKIFEDLFSPFISGVINVKESFDFINLFPFVGEEYLKVYIYTPSLPVQYHINQDFYIYKVSDRIVLGDRSTVYQIHFISKEALVDVNKNISKSYSGKISDIATDICSNMVDGLQSSKKLNIESTGNTTKFISNFWSPVKCLNYAAGTASTVAGASDYIFFENRNGLNFLSLDSLYRQDVAQSFVYDKYLRDDLADGRTIINIAKDYARIMTISVPVVFDYLDRIRSGMFASKMVSTDITVKKYVVNNFDMLQDFASNKHTNKYPSISNKLVKRNNSLVINYPKYYGAFNAYTDVSNSRTIQKRLSQLAQAQSTKLIINVFGRTDYTVGMKVNLTLNKVAPMKKGATEEELRDNILSGNYIISAINHIIDRKQHECVMELIKDSFIINLNTGKP